MNKAKIKFFFKKHGPDILVGLGLGTLVGTITYSYYAPKSKKSMIVAAAGTVVGTGAVLAGYGMMKKRYIIATAISSAHYITNKEEYAQPVITESNYVYRNEYSRATSTLAVENDFDTDQLFVDAAREYCMGRLENDGYIFLNDILKCLGMDKIAIGQLQGYLCNKEFQDEIYIDLIQSNDSDTAFIEIRNLRPNILCDMPV